jgi:hypothetical protein
MVNSKRKCWNETNLLQNHNKKVFLSGNLVNRQKTNPKAILQNRNKKVFLCSNVYYAQHNYIRCSVLRMVLVMACNIMQPLEGIRSVHASIAN